MINTIQPLKTMLLNHNGQGKEYDKISSEINHRNSIINTHTYRHIQGEYKSVRKYLRIITT